MDRLPVHIADDSTTGAMNFIQELKERKVFRVATVYVVAMWLVIQITADLPGFWSGSWAEVRREMAGRGARRRPAQHVCDRD